MIKNTTINLILAIILILIILSIRTCKGENFVSAKAKEIYKKTKDIFDNKADEVSYTKYKKQISEADPVMFSDTWNMYRSGKLTPENVQKLL